jgi:hypothetical protein
MLLALCVEMEKKKKKTLTPKMEKNIFLHYINEMLRKNTKLLYAQRARKEKRKKIDS